MLCSKCKKNPASVYIKKSVNGAAMETSLCTSCANEEIYHNQELFAFPDFFGNGGFLNNILDFKHPAEKTTVQACSLCGANKEDIYKTGKFGCSNCYETFFNEMLPSLIKIHGNSTHIGKIPKRYGSEIGRKRKIEDLKLQLQKLIVTEEFEQAAEVRDKIKELENGGAV